jgi:hypothetical protein
MAALIVKSRPTIFTSNFAADGKNPQAVSIARYAPRGFAGRRYLPLAPTTLMLKINDREQFSQAYLHKLSKIDANQVVADLGDGAVMLCYEDFNVYCHRRMVAEWIEEKLGVVVLEIGHERADSMPWREMPLKPHSRKKFSEEK